MNSGDPNRDDSLPDLSSDGVESTKDSRTEVSAKERKQIGPYKILQKIAEGGMGAVYMAQQNEPIKRRVALKLIKAGRDTEQIIARFDAERQALAMMDHANIARIFDAGTTEEGSPYFVMELVNGVPLTEYCDRNKLSIRERLELFVPVCKAVQHAHTKGIIHRDLKPSNVLVALYDGVAVPKVIDFGLAKATEHQLALTDKTMFTEFGQIVGTIQYMSPEQAEMNQLDIDTRTDVYSLGVMLYELLTGSTPLDEQTMKEQALLKVLELIREKEPPRPSTRLSSIGESATSVSRQRKIATSKLQQILKGELDWIVMKALDKDRTRRYETANRFADDIQRFLEDREVLARPPSRWYRLSKFVKKNVAAVATAALFAAVLVAATAVSINYAIIANSQTVEAKKQRLRAEREKDGQKKVTRLFTNVLDAGDPVFGMLSSKYGGTLGRAASMEEVVRRVATDELAEKSELVDVPVVRGQLISTLGDILLSYGDVRQSLALFQKADEIFRQEGVSSGAELARNEMGLGTCNYLLGNLKPSESQLESAQALAEEIRATDSGDADVTRVSAFASFMLAAVRIEYEDFDAADKHLQQTSRLCEPGESETLTLLGSFAKLFSNVVVLYRGAVEGADLSSMIPALASMLESIERGGTLFEPFQGILNAEMLAIAGADPTPAYQALHKKLTAAVGEGHFLTALSLYALAETGRRYKKFDDTTKRYEELITLVEKRLGRDNSRLSMVLHNYGRFLFNHWRESDRSEEAHLLKARELFDEAVQSRRKHFGGHPLTAGSLHYLARVEANLKDYEKALDYHRQAFEIRKSQGPVSRLVSGALYRIAGTLRNLERHTEAAEIAREMLEVDSQLLAKETITKAELGFRQDYATRIFADAGIDQKEIQALLEQSLTNLKTESKRFSSVIKQAEERLKAMQKGEE